MGRPGQAVNFFNLVRRPELNVKSTSHVSCPESSKEPVAEYERVHVLCGLEDNGGDIICLQTSVFQHRDPSSGIF